MIRLLIARHGNTFNKGETPRRVGITDLPLVESGLEQGRKLGAYLKQNQLVPDVIFTSHLQRTQQTAHEAQSIMETSLPLNPLTIFNEIDYGIDENREEPEVVARLGKQALTEWDEEAIVPNGWQVNPKLLIENWQHFASNLVNHYETKTVLVVTSNGIARFAPYLTGDFEQFRKQYALKIATGAVCLFEYDGEKWECRFWNERP